MKNLFPITKEILNLASNRSVYADAIYLDGSHYIKGISVQKGFGLAIIDEGGNERVRGFGSNFLNALKDLIENVI